MLSQALISAPVEDLRASALRFVRAQKVVYLEHPERVAERCLELGPIVGMTLLKGTPYFAYTDSHHHVHLAHITTGAVVHTWTYSHPQFDPSRRLEFASLSVHGCPSNGPILVIRTRSKLYVLCLSNSCAFPSSHLAAAPQT
jgi:hypothetical protein